MRKFINLNKSDQHKLSAQFPNLLELVSVEETLHYNYLAVSVFDGWLGAEVFALDSPSEKEQKNRNDALFSFSNKLASETDIINFKISGKRNQWKPRFRGFTSNRAKIEYLKPSNKVNFKVVLPELGIVFLEGYDYTNVMYLKDLAFKAQIKQWATECGVYCIDKLS